MMHSDSIDFFSDATVSRLRQQGCQILHPSGVEIVFPASAGFCHGVAYAVKKLCQHLAQDNLSSKRKFLLGPMIHNETVNQAFSESGVTVLSKGQADSEFPKKSLSSDCYIIPAFGLSIEDEEKLRAFACADAEIIDCSCPNVRYIWRKVKELGGQGHAVLLHGSPGHHEVMGIWSRIKRETKAAALIPDLQAAKKFIAAYHKGFPENSYKSYLHNAENFAALPWTMLNQTTMLHKDCIKIAEYFQKETAGKNEFTWLKTTCQATRLRQQEAAELCESDCDLILVLGSITSSNTGKLYLLAKEKQQSYFVSNAENLQKNNIKHYLLKEKRWENTQNWLPDNLKKIGILCGASCPDLELGKLLNKLQKILD